MKVHPAVKAALCLLVAGPLLSTKPAAAQLPSGVNPPPKYIFLSNIAIKPNMAGSVIAAESSEVQAERAANAPIHYFGMLSFTGSPHALFFAGFDSFADMQKEHDQGMSDPKLQEALKSGDAAEAPALSDTHGSIYKYRDDLSLNAAVDISQMRFFDITVFHVRYGHYEDWEHLVKIYEKAYSTIPNAHWAMFEKLYGEDSDRTFILVTPIKALAEEDQAMIDGDNLPKTVGADQMQLMRELGSQTVESSESDLFAIVPQISYVPDAWLTASPDFWGKK
ncbi:MAG: hypothetical protein ABSE36_03695 [Terracidiphilus sp.]|jgi:hypothetical protein